MPSLVWGWSPLAWANVILFTLIRLARHLILTPTDLGPVAVRCRCLSLRLWASPWWLLWEQWGNQWGRGPFSSTPTKPPFHMTARWLLEWNQICNLFYIVLARYVNKAFMTLRGIKRFQSWLPGYRETGVWSQGTLIEITCQPPRCAASLRLTWSWLNTCGNRSDPCQTCPALTVS